LINWQKEWLLGTADRSSMPLRSEWSSSRGERTRRAKRDAESSEYSQKRVVFLGEGMFGDHLAMQMAIGLDPQWIRQCLGA
jgi:hypothetical protein